MRAALFLLLFYTVWAQAEEGIAVVISQQSPVKQLSRDDISALYMGNLPSDPASQALVPLDLTDSTARDTFYQQLLGRSRNQMRAYWARMVFTGKGKPPKTFTPQEVLQALTDDPQRIAYLPRSAVTEQLRTLLSLP